MGRLRINGHHPAGEGSLRVAEQAMSLFFILAPLSSARLRMSHKFSMPVLYLLPCCGFGLERQKQV